MVLTFVYLKTKVFIKSSVAKLIILNCILNKENNILNVLTMSIPVIVGKIVH